MLTRQEPATDILTRPGDPATEILSRTEPAPVGPRRRPYSALLALPVVAIALAVTGLHAGRRQLWEDEYATWQAATLSTHDFLHLMRNIDLAIGPYYLIMRGWVALAGTSPGMLRAPSVVAIALTAGVIVLVGRQLFSTATGVVAGLLFVALPVSTRYAQDARPYALAMLFACAATWLLLRSLAKPTWPRWLLYGLVLVMMGLAHVVTLAILPAHFLLVRHRVKATDTLRYWRWLAALIMVIAVVGPFAQYASRQSGAISWITLDRQTLIDLPRLLFGATVPAAALVGLALVAGLIPMIWVNRPAAILLGCWSLLPPLLTAATFPVLHLFLYRYLLFTVPAWALLAAGGLDQLGRAVVPRGKAAVAGVLGVAAVVALGWLGLPGQADVRHDPLDGYPDYRAVAARIHAGQRPGDGIAFGGLYYRVRRGMSYELAGQTGPRDVFLAVPSKELGGYVARECVAPAACLGETKRIWLVNTAKSDDPLAEMSTATSALLRSQFKISRSEQFTGVRLVLLTAVRR